MFINISTYDGYIIKGKLSLPEGNDDIKKLVIWIAGAGMGTYTTYNNGFPISLFTEKGTAYFSFNKRGVDVTDEEPFFSVNNDIFKTYIPSNCINDVYQIIIELKNITRLAKCQILLIGWSEGAMIAPLFASKYPDMVNALFLCGYPNDNLKELQRSMWTKMDGGNEIFNKVLSAVEEKNDEWLIENNGPPLEWLSEHYNLKSNSELLPTLDLPIYIFHGALDANCDVQGVYIIKDIFTQLNKTNLSINVFDNHDHNLDTDDSKDGRISEGVQSLLDTIINF
jgi:hypothetical protein